MAEKITPLLQALLDCVTARLILDGRPVCEACIVAGADIPPADGCDCNCESGQGRAWIRLISLEFSSLRPTVGIGSEVQKCPTGAWLARIETGVWRCIKDQGKGRCVDLIADATAMHADLASLSAAIQCCPAITPSMLWIPESVKPLGPLGGCAGAAMYFTIQVPKLV